MSSALIFWSSIYLMSIIASIIRRVGLSVAFNGLRLDPIMLVDTCHYIFSTIAHQLSFS